MMAQALFLIHIGCPSRMYRVRDVKRQLKIFVRGPMGRRDRRRRSEKGPAPGPVGKNT